MVFGTVDRRPWRGVIFTGGFCKNSGQCVDMASSRAVMSGFFWQRTIISGRFWRDVIVVVCNCWIIAR